MFLQQHLPLRYDYKQEFVCLRICVFLQKVTLEYFELVGCGTRNSYKTELTFTTQRTRVVCWLSECALLSIVIHVKTACKKLHDLTKLLCYVFYGNLLTSYSYFKECKRWEQSPRTGSFIHE